MRAYTTPFFTSKAVVTAVALLCAIATSSFAQNQPLTREQQLAAFRAQYQSQIDSLGKIERRLFQKIKPFDRRGLWGSVQFGWSGERYQSRWGVDTTCGCDGQVVSIDTGFYDRNRARTVGFSLTYRFAQKWGIRSSGQLSWLTVRQGETVRGPAGEFATLPTPYRYRQPSANVTLVRYFGKDDDPLRQRLHYYAGAGTQGRFGLRESQSHPRNTETPTSVVVSEMGRRLPSPPLQPVGFLGLRFGKKVQLTYELGWNATFYNHFTLEVPLSRRIRTSWERHQATSAPWFSVSRELLHYHWLMLAKEQALFPERFQTSGGGDGGGGDGGSSGGSSGGGCGSGY